MKNPLKLFSRHEVNQKALSEMVFAQVNALSSLFRLPRTRINYAAEVGTGLDTSVVMNPVNWIQRTFPEAPVIVERRRNGMWELVEEHAMIQRLDEPNTFYSGVSLWAATLLSYCLDGNAYWIKVKSNRGQPLELWYTPHWMLEPIWPQSDPSIFISGYKYNTGLGSRTLDVDDVVHFRWGIDPYNVRKGLSPIRAVLREVFTDIEAENWIASLMRNQAVPGVVISPESTGGYNDAIVSENDLKSTEAYIKQQFTGDNRGMPLALRGPTKVQEFGYDPQRMDVRNLRRVPEERLSGALGVPPILSNFGAGLDRSTFANFAEAREAGYESTIIPMQRVFSSELRTQLLRDYGSTDSLRVAFDNSNIRILQEDENKRSERLIRWLEASGITLAEWRRMNQLEADESHEVYYRRVNIVVEPVGQRASDGGQQASEPGQASLAPGERKAALQDAMIRALDNDAKQLQPVFADALVDAFDALGAAVEDVFNSLSLPPLGAYPEQSSWDYITDAAMNPFPDYKFGADSAWKQNDPNDDIVVDGIMQQTDFDEWDRETFGPAYSAHYLRTAEMTFNSVNAVLELSTDLPDPVARQIVATGGTRRGLVDVRAQTRTSIYRALHDGRSLGEGPPALARRIREQVPAGRFSSAGPRYRAQLIARTETKYAQNVSSLAAYRETEVVTGVQAFDAQAGDTDLDCELRNGQIYTFDEAARITEEEHPNGTLSWAPVTG